MKNFFFAVPLDGKARVCVFVHTTHHPLRTSIHPWTPTTWMRLFSEAVAFVFMWPN